MTQNFHWNVEGPYFFTLHTMFEQQYTDFALAVDSLAERIRTLGATAPGTFEEFARLSKVRQVAAPLSAKLMVATLLDANQTVTTTLREVAILATEAGDEETNGLAVDRMQIHEKFAWMLRATLAGE